MKTCFFLETWRPENERHLVDSELVHPFLAPTKQDLFLQGVADGHPSNNHTSCWPSQRCQLGRYLAMYGAEWTFLVLRDETFGFLRSTGIFGLGRHLCLSEHWSFADHHLETQPQYVSAGILWIGTEMRCTSLLQEVLYAALDLTCRMPPSFFKLGCYKCWCYLVIYIGFTVLLRL